MSYLRDLCCISGVGLVLYGLAMVSIPVAVVSGGVCLVVLALCWSFVSERGKQ